MNRLGMALSAWIANLEVATGRLLQPTVQQTRTEHDFVEPVRQTVKSDPQSEWIFVAEAQYASI